MSTNHATQPTAHPPIPDGRPETWVVLRDRPMPPDGQRDVDREYQAYRYSRKERLWLEEGVKLAYLFPGQWVGLRDIAGRLVVVWAGDFYSPEFIRYRDSLNSQERNQTLFMFVEDPYAPPVTRI